MKSRYVLLLSALLATAACGGSSDEAGVEDAALPEGTVDTAGMGVNPPTAGGQVVDTAAQSGPVDTAQGTPTAP